MVSKLNLFCPILHLSIFQQTIVEKLELDKVFDEGNDDETKEWIVFKEGSGNTYSVITHVPELLAIVAERIPDQSFKINWADEVFDEGKNTTSVRNCIDNLIRKKNLSEHKQKEEMEDFAGYSFIYYFNYWFWFMLAFVVWC